MNVPWTTEQAFYTLGAITTGFIFAMILFTE